MAEVNQSYPPGAAPELEPFFEALIQAIKTQAAKITLSSSQAIGGSTYELITFDQDDFDEGSLSDLSNNRMLLSAGDEGIYLIFGSIESDNSSGTEDVRLQVSDSTVAERTGLTAGSPHQIFAIEELVDGDYVELEAKSSAGTGNWLSDTDTYLAIVKV